MNKKIENIVKEIKSYLIKTFGDRIKEVMVYGSYARGDYTMDSDVDVLIVIDDSIKPSEVEKHLNDLLFNILLEKNELISVIAVPESLFRNYNSPFMLNVREEGVPV